MNNVFKINTNNRLASLEEIEANWNRRNWKAKAERMKPIERVNDIRDKINNALLVGIVIGACFAMFISSYI